jgi:hypothetical protein
MSEKRLFSLDPPKNSSQIAGSFFADGRTLRFSAFPLFRFSAEAAAVAVPGPSLLAQGWNPL